MQMLANLAFGAIVAGLSLGPAGWSDVAAVDARLSQAVMSMVHAHEAASPLSRAVTRAREALPHMSGSH